MIFFNRNISCYHTQRKQIVLLYIGALPTRTEGRRQQGHNGDTALVPVPVYPPEVYVGGATDAVEVVGVQAP